MTAGGDDDEIAEARAGLLAEVQRMAAEWVDLSRQMGVELDYGEPSVARLEEQLAMLSAEDMSERGRELTVHRAGCYLLEVGRRAYGGHFQWWEDREAPVLVLSGPDFQLGLLTWDKVRGRLGGDEDDNIPFFYEGFAERARKCEPGTSATYV